LLTGNGLEIGAFHQPSEVPNAIRVEYFDAIDEEKAAELFPEVAADSFVKVTYFGDLDLDGLDQFPEGKFDFLIISHVLEHVANPVKVLRAVFRVVRQGGLVVLAIPDKHFTFDRERAITAFEHLWKDFEDDVCESSDEHYIDFLKSAGRHVFDEPPECLPGHISRARTRREHAHVWDSPSFQAFLSESFERLGIVAHSRYESVAAENQFEYFGVWEKQ
jgi:SAM-dependent methyltransferase